MLLRMIVVAQEVNFTPDFDAIPGAGPVQTLINGIGAFALLIALVGIIIGGAMWGVGSLSSNYHQAAVGKRATLYSVVGTLIVPGQVRYSLLGDRNTAVFGLVLAGDHDRQRPRH
jgi:type IV secretory pathway VirB2 component (pilin)